VEIVEERTVGPSLGRDSINQGITSFIVGGAFVILFMIAYYKGAGLVAVVALVFNVVFMISMLAGFQAVLTLPGIAGIVLTVGMAVDANVLINERIREEIRRRAVRSPSKPVIKMPYRRSWTQYHDLLLGVILFPVRHRADQCLAVTLCIGILTTVSRRSI
jgi:preprotein translocase subunit SecD